MRLLLVLLLSLAPLACSLLAGTHTLGEYRHRLDRLQEEIEEAVAEAQASEGGQCRVRTYGDKACGGHTRAVVYSVADGVPNEVERLTDAYTRLEREMNERLGLVSDCAIEPVPEAALEDGRCVARYE